MSLYETIFSLHDLALEDGRRYAKRRDAFDALLSSEGAHFLGIYGSRGVGKSIVLKQLADTIDGSVYISIDTLTDSDDVFDVVTTLNKTYKITTFLLDEVHFRESIDRDLKKIYDFLNVKVIFTSSVALSMLQSSHDLSRRVRLHTLYPFSFREYLYFKHDMTLEALSLADIYACKWTGEHMRGLMHFDTYLQGNNWPFALDDPMVRPLLENILTKIISHDISCVSDLKLSDLELMTKLVAFVGRSSIDGINYSTLAANLGITKYRATLYVELLCRAFVLVRLLPKGTNVLQEPKVMMTLGFRLLFQTLEAGIGAIREEVVVGHLLMGGFDVAYLKSTRGAKTPDFLVCEDGQDYVVEVGGRTKGRTQFKGVAVDKKLVFSHGLIDATGIRRPLGLCGYLA